MNTFVNIGWSSLIVFFIFGLIGIWISYSFLNKNGLYLFCIIVPIISAMMPNAELFSRKISISTVLVPIIFLAIIACFNKYGKQEAIKLFIITLVSQATVFLVMLLQSAYIDSFIKSRFFMTWEVLGSYFANILAFAFACFGVMIFEEKVNLKKVNKVLKTACLIAVACVIESLVYSIVAYSGILTFGKILVTWLIKLLLSLAIAICLGYFEKLLNRQLAFKIVKAERKEDEETSKNQKEKSTNATQKSEKETELKEENKEDNAEDINYENSAD